MKTDRSLWPRLWDIRLSVDLLPTGSAVGALSDASYRALMCMVAYSAADLVWTYSPPGEGALPDDDVRLARIAGMAPKRWRRIRPDLEPFFAIADGVWRLNQPWVLIDSHPARVAIPAEIREAVLRREGKICTYCADTDGPFDFDHILPVIAGGTNDPSNITLACIPCNRSKGGRTLRDWMARR